MYLYIYIFIYIYIYIHVNIHTGYCLASSSSRGAIHAYSKEISIYPSNSCCSSMVKPLHLEHTT